MRRENLSHAIRQRLVHYAPPHDAHYGVAMEPPTRQDVYAKDHASRHRDAIAAIAEVDAWVRETGDAFKATRLLARQEAVRSSAIEGTNSTLDELLRVEDAEDDAATQATKQVRDYALVLEKVVPQARNQGRAIFTRDLVCRLHKAIMAEDPDYRDTPGEIRTVVVTIGPGHIAQSIWNPPPPYLVSAGLDDAIAYLRDEDEYVLRQSLVARMAISHAHFEAVHPFRDGNGRVGRLMLPLMMAAEGHIPLYLAPYIEANKQEYSKALQSAQQREEWSEMIGFIASAIVGTVHELNATRKVLQNIRVDWGKRRRFRKGAASTLTLDLLAGHPIVTVKRLAELLDVSVKNAGEAVSQLVEVGILRERTGYARNRIFVANEILDVVNRSFGAEPEWLSDLWR